MAVRSSFGRRGDSVTGDSPEIPALVLSRILSRAPPRYSSAFSVDLVREEPSKGPAEAESWSTQTGRALAKD